MNQIVKKLLTVVAVFAMVLPVGVLFGCVDSSGSTTPSDSTNSSDLTDENTHTKQQNITKAITNGVQKVNSSKTDIIFTIDMSEYFEEDEETDISFSVSYSLKVNQHYLPGNKPHWFDFKFYSKREVNDVYKIGEAVCDWDGGEYANVSNATFDATLKGNKIYIAADSNTWVFGYNVSDFSVNMQFTDII